MSENTNTQQARTVTSEDHGKLDVRALVLLAVLLAAGFILNFTVGKAISSISGGMISPEFIISAFCLTILVIRPNVPQALVIGLISAAVIQITTTSPIPAIGTFVTTVVSGVIFMIIRIAMVGAAQELAAAMLPVVFATAIFNAILVQALYIPVCKALKVND